MEIVTMIVHKQRILAVLIALISITTTTQVMDDKLAEEKALLSKRPLAELVTVSKNHAIIPELRTYALQMLIYQERDFELQAYARLMLAHCYRTGALHKRQSMSTAYELIEPIGALPVSTALKKQAQEELTLLMTLKRKRVSAQE